MPAPNSLMRESPLPPGRYWVDLVKREEEDQPGIFNEWAKANAGLVRVLATEEQDGDPPVTWYLFETFEKPDGFGGMLRPEWVALGFPSVAASDVKSHADVFDGGVQDTSAPLWTYGLIAGGAALLLWQLRALFGGKSE